MTVLAIMALMVEIALVTAFAVILSAIVAIPTWRVVAWAVRRWGA